MQYKSEAEMNTGDKQKQTNKKQEQIKHRVYSIRDKSLLRDNIYFILIKESLYKACQKVRKGKVFER